MQRIAIIGSGVSGLVAARHLSHRGEVVLFESDNRVGGHANTVEVEEGDRTLGIDTGFIVYNEPNYPGFSALLDDLGVATKPSDMSFSVSSSLTGLEYRGSSLNTLLARRSNILRPSFLRMLADIPRFNRAARSLLDHDDVSLSLDEFLRREGFSRPFVDDYLIPLGAAIWSANPQEFSAFPATSLARFLDQHGLLSLGNRPPWRTVVGGSQRYVEALVSQFSGQIRASCAVRLVERDESGVVVRSDAQPEGERFDLVVFATHADTALAMLASPSVLKSQRSLGHSDSNATVPRFTVTSGSCRLDDEPGPVGTTGARATNSEYRYSRTTRIDCRASSPPPITASRSTRMR